MAYTWGSTALKILWGTLRHACMAAPVVEISLLPDPAALSTVSSVLQQQGRGRNRVKCKLYVTTAAAYDTYVTDMNAGTERTLTIEDTSIAATYMIESLGEPEFVQDNVVFFDICWVEV